MRATTVTGAIAALASGCLSTSQWVAKPIARAGRPGSTVAINAYTTSDHARHPCRGAVRLPGSREDHALVFVCSGQQRLSATDSTLLSIDARENSPGRIFVDAILVGAVLLIFLLPRDDCAFAPCFH